MIIGSHRGEIGQARKKHTNTRASCDVAKNRRDP
jgi:hypothetical protein